jgi:parallel beta-helix repeat protein
LTNAEPWSRNFDKNPLITETVPYYGIDMKKTAVVTLILIGLMTLGIVCIKPIKAEYQGDITINADGSISPSTAPIQQTGDTYTLTGDVIGSITVMRSNMTFDGNGHSLIGLGAGHGVEGLSVGCNYYSSPPVLTGASNVTVKNLAVKGSVSGISLVETTNALIFNNTVLETRNVPFQPTAGIDVEGGGSNTITGNNLINNDNGMSFLETQNNLIIGNNIENSSGETGGYGIVFWGASNNIIYHNSFINNKVQAHDYSFNSPFSINTWDDGYLGNYWSDYKTKYPSAVQMGDSGVYNIPYSIDAQNIDRYPLTQPFNSAFYAPKVPPKISLLSPVNQEFNESSVPLFFTVDKQAVWMGYSLDGQDNITITGNTTIAGLSSGLHNITVYAKDEFENMGASETISFSVAEVPFPTALVAVAFIASAAAVSAALLVYFKKRRATNLKRNNEI